MNYSECRFLVTDFDACFRFFRDGLGLPVTFGEEGGGYASFDAGGPSVSIYSRAGMEEAMSQPGALGGNGAMLALRADDLGAAVQRALAHGGTLVSAERDYPAWMLRAAHIASPDGHLIEVHRPLE